MEIGKPEREVEVEDYPASEPLKEPWHSPTESPPLHIGEPVREIKIPEPMPVPG
jgi:hypothetical protein